MKQFKRELKRNHRLRFAFDLCLELGIDDPMVWFNACPPHVLDCWIAHRSLSVEELEDAQRSSTDPESVYQRLSRNAS